MHSLTHSPHPLTWHMIPRGLLCGGWMYVMFATATCGNAFAPLSPFPPSVPAAASIVLPFLPTMIESSDFSLLGFYLLSFKFQIAVGPHKRGHRRCQKMPDRSLISGCSILCCCQLFWASSSSAAILWHAIFARRLQVMQFRSRPRCALPNRISFFFILR